MQGPPVHPRYCHPDLWIVLDIEGCRRAHFPARVAGRDTRRQQSEFAATNQEIATRLFLSVRTVESHVRNILTRLDLTRRAEVALWLQTYENNTARHR
ncbi:response regulator transcription factor [Gordonia sp. CPCC 205333]|uniref:response regulator transcription factor n=1 Tax=Gordonia sp. CPCC 205333 TaxID=3140790 RepID=UPI003AF39B20